MRNYSPKNSLSVIDLSKIWTGLKISATGVAGAIVLDMLSQAVLNADMGTYTGIVVGGLCATAANALRKFRAESIS